MTGCPGVDWPVEVPPDWLPFTDWSCSCILYYPPVPEAQVPPIEWEPCPPENQLFPSCEWMKRTWTEDSKYGVGVSPGLAIEEDGTVLLGFRRSGATVPDPYGLEVVAEADGVVRSALLDIEPALGGCMTNGSRGGMERERRLLSLIGEVNTDAQATDRDGLLIVPHESGIPMAKFDASDPGLRSWYSHGDQWLVRFQGLGNHAIPWSDLTAAPLFVTSPAADPDGLQPTPIPFGDVVFLNQSKLAMHGIDVWDPVNGTRPFVRWPGDYTKGAGDFGTDGVDMVWTYGEGKQPDDIEYPFTQIVTAPFTTEPALVQPKVLRTLPFYLNSKGWVVGCGYAAIMYGTLTVVRLSDGWMWEFPIGDQSFYIEPFGMTCEHLYGRADGIGLGSSIARIPLAGLGPGIPP